MFNLPRASLISKVTKLFPYFPTLRIKNLLDILFNGIDNKSNKGYRRNVPIIFAMQSYISSAKRFEKQPLSFILHPSQFIPYDTV